MDRKDLKIQALLERVSQQESQLADFRVEMTVLSNEVEQLRAEREQRAPEAEATDDAD